MKLDGLRVAALATNGFQTAELLEPMQALREAGATVDVISDEGGTIQGTQEGASGQVAVDRTVDAVEADDYDALLLPGGVKNPDTLRQNEDAVRFVRSFHGAGKPIAAICHAPWMLVEADAVRGRRLTSYPSLKTDILNAGGQWEDSEVVVDQGLVTSRRPADIPAFNAKMIEEFGEGVHSRSGAAAAASRD